MDPELNKEVEKTGDFMLIMMLLALFTFFGTLIGTDYATPDREIGFSFAGIFVLLMLAGLIRWSEAYRLKSQSFGNGSRSGPDWGY